MTHHSACCNKARGRQKDKEKEIETASPLSVSPGLRLLLGRIVLSPMCKSLGHHCIRRHQD